MTVPLHSITDHFVCIQGCQTCGGTGMACEDHPSQAMGHPLPDGQYCGGAGIPCPATPFTTVWTE